MYSSVPTRPVNLTGESRPALTLVPASSLPPEERSGERDWRGAFVSDCGSGKGIGKSVIDIAVMRLVGADRNDDLAQACVGLQLPVVDGDAGRRDVAISAVINPAAGLIADRRPTQRSLRTNTGPRS